MCMVFRHACAWCVLLGNMWIVTCMHTHTHTVQVHISQEPFSFLLSLLPKMFIFKLSFSTYHLSFNIFNKLLTLFNKHLLSSCSISGTNVQYWWFNTGSYIAQFLGTLTVHWNFLFGLFLLPSFALKFKQIEWWVRIT